MAETSEAQIATLRKLVTNTEYQHALKQIELFITGTEPSEDQMIFFNFCQIFIFYKLKEYANANTLTESIIDKYSGKEVLFTEREVPFGVKYMHALILYEMRNKSALSVLYELLGECE
jgi:hypothetical protein